MDRQDFTTNPSINVIDSCSPTLIQTTEEPMISLTRMPVLVLVLFLSIASAMVVVSSASQASQKNQGKFLQIDGQVTVNGTNAISGATVFSDSTVTTAARSSAVVSLGKLGRVEVLPQSTVKLIFSDESVSVGMLDAGRVRISSSSNVTAKATTRNGDVISTGNQRNEFIVDTSCGNTFVSVKKGTVELRAGSTVKQIAAGNQDTAGTATPGCTPAP
jgi:hypothetical protein